MTEKKKRKKRATVKKSYKKPPGKPKATWDLAEVERLARVGLSHRSIANMLGYSVETLQKHIREGDFSLQNAIRVGRAINELDLKKALMHKATVELDTKAITYALGTIHDIAERQTITHEGGLSLDVTHTIAQMTPEERKARIEALEEKRKLLK